MTVTERHAACSRRPPAPATLACTTTDSAHFVCTEKLKLVQHVPVTVTVKSKSKPCRSGARAPRGLPATGAQSRLPRP